MGDISMNGSTSINNGGGSSNMLLQTNYFLLKTENIKPLIDLSQQLNNQIKQNETLLSRLNHLIDHQLKLPHLDEYDEGVKEIGDVMNDDEIKDGIRMEKEERRSSPEEVEEEDDDEEADKLRREQINKSQYDDVDSLRYLLIKKYDLPTNYDDSSNINIDKSKRRIEQLINDNQYLSKLVQFKKDQNQNLFKIINDYETFIIEMILPNLRSDKLSIKHSNDKHNDNANDNNDNDNDNDTSIQAMINKKFSKIDVIYKRYNAIIIKFVTINNLLNNLINLLIQQDNKSHYIIYQLEILQNLKDELMI
ncbi:hypothetical protein DFJ63DRAFT_333942 [Scheffersomyces coipomensis]|uniref:uncharacterized protein n=1 Tax=Scheffersomyces coipomensis TaxID=1788519 RepID=UPI00315D501F